MGHAEHDPSLSQPPHIPNQALGELSWAHTRLRQKARLTFLGDGARLAPHITMQSTAPETDIIVRRQYLLRSLGSCAIDVDTQRPVAFMREQNVRIVPYRFVDEADTAFATKHFGDIEDLAGAYMPSLDIALVRRLLKLEAINGPAFIESVLVHELAHGANTHHHLVYRKLGTQKPTKLHGRSGSYIFDSHGTSRGRFLEEGYAERMRGLYVEEVLKRPRGIAGDDIDGNHFMEGGSRVSLRYTIRRTNGQPYVTRESFAGQVLDHLCQVDPALGTDLHLARTSVEGLRNVAKRINAIKPGLYVYLRDTPFTRADFRQRLIYVQRWLWHKRRHPAFSAH